MTINIAVAYDHPLDIGGVETHLLSLLKYSQNQAVHFVIFAPVTERFRNLAERYDVQITAFENWNIFDPILAFKLRGLFIQHNIDLVHAHSPTAGAAARLAARLAGIPAAVTVHLPVYLYHGRKSTLRAGLGRFVYTRIDQVLNHLLTDALIYVSKSVMDECLQRKLSPSRISYFIPNGVDLVRNEELPDREHLREKYGVGQDDCILIFVGRLEDQKGADLLPALTLPLLEEFPELKLWIVGDGPLRQLIESQLEAPIQSQQVCCWGYQQDVGAFLKASDIFIMPSRYEALPYVLLEALAAGLPCIATDTGDTRLLVEHGENGYLVPLDGTADFRDAIRSLVSNKTLRAQQAGKSKEKVTQYGEEGSVQRIFQVYKAIISRASSK
jgi:glycosyltransferase involved in cell wall biosynthesis